MTDINMPGMDGLSFIELARRTSNGRGLPIFVLSSETCPAKLARAEALGIQAWMTKPMSAPVVIAHLLAAA
jgi:two-component system chemotaxis response regulator CheY